MDVQVGDIIKLENNQFVTVRMEVIKVSADGDKVKGQMYNRNTISQ